MRFIPKTKKKRIILAVVILAVAVLVYVLLTRGKDVVEEVTQPNKKYYSQLTGAEVEKEVSERPVLGVMIENSEEARPQSGLDSAGIVFETVTEAGITRYLALFQENMPEEVGPVRSVRPAFVDWVMGFDATIAHVGGSELALQMLENRANDAKDMNEFSHPESFYRRPDREAPHDAYAKTVALTALQKQLDHETSEFDELLRSEDSPANPATVKVISLQFSHPIFGATFTYDAAANSYLRSLAGSPHVDAATNQQISVKNLVVIKADIQEGATGSGEAVLYKDGSAQNIRWELKDYKNRIKLLDSTGAEAALNRGDTWFAILPSSGSSTVQ